MGPQCLYLSIEDMIIIIEVVVSIYIYIKGVYVVNYIPRYNY